MGDACMYAHDSCWQRPPQAAESPERETFEGAGVGAKQHPSNPPSITRKLLPAKHANMADPIDSAL